MDPAGIREILLVRPYSSNPYLFEYIARGLPFKTRFYHYYFNIPWLPLHQPLTRRVSIVSEGYTGWLQHDLAVVAGTDLQSFEERDIQNMRCAAERGLPLFLCGGGFGLGTGYRLWYDLESVLPAKVPAAAPIPCQGEAAVVSNHPILQGLPEAFGRVKALHPLEVHDDATVLLAVDKQPVLVASESCGGRQMICAVAEADGLFCDGLATEGFYGHPFYGDLMRRCMTWLMGVKAPVSFSRLRLETGHTLHAPGEHRFHVSVRREAAAESARLRLRVFSVDDGKIMVGGDTVRTDLLRTEVHPVNNEEAQFTFTLTDVHPGLHLGLYEVDLDIEIDNPPRQAPAALFGMMRGPTFDNWKGSVVDRRQFRLRFPDQRRTRVFVPGRTCALTRGKTWAVRLCPPGPATAELVIHDADGREVGAAAGARSAEQQELTWKAPSLVDGEYNATLRVRLENGQAETFRFSLLTSPQFAQDDEFQIIGHGCPRSGDEGEIRLRIKEYMDEFGLAALSSPCMSQSDLFGDETSLWHEQPSTVKRIPWIDAMAANMGRCLWIDFDAPLVLLKTHGGEARYCPTEPCVLHPDYEKTVRALLKPRLELLRTRPRFISAEIIDEPHLFPANVCRCSLCREAYREHFGEEMPVWEELGSDQTSHRWHFFEWLLEYTTRAFATAYRVKQDVASEIGVHNVAIDRLFVSNFMFNGMHRWARYGDGLYMACYPFAYLNYRGRDQVPHSQTHWIAAWIRGIARHYGKQWGVFMELWEHDTPNRWMPPCWPVGQFYALLAEGVERLDTFLAVFGCEHFGIGWDRLREFGREINKVRPFLPLLCRAKRPRARIALVNPWCEWVMNPQPHRLPPGHEGYGYYRRYAFPVDDWYPHERRRMLVYELFHRVFRDIDQVDETLLCEEPILYEALIINDCAFLTRRTMETIASFVAKGGVLILDCSPNRDENGERLNLMEVLAECVAHRPGNQQEKTGSSTECDARDEQAGTVIPGLTYRIMRFGQGRVLQFSRNLQLVYANVLESEMAGIRRRLESSLADLLAVLGLQSRFLTSSGDVDAGLRLGDGWCLVPVANLGTKPHKVDVTIRSLPFRPAFGVNLTEGELLELDSKELSVSFSIALKSYHGALVALYDSQPFNCLVAMTSTEVNPGDILNYEIALTDAHDQPLKGTFMVQVTITDATGREHPQLGGSRMVEGGRIRLCPVMPVNARSGNWTIAVQELILGLCAQTTFSVRAP